MFNQFRSRGIASTTLAKLSGPRISSFTSASGESIFIFTPGTEEALADPVFKADVLSRIALGRIGDPAEVGAAVVYLASPAAGLVTGHTLLIETYRI